MRKEGNSELSDKRSKSNVKKKDEEGNSEAPEEMYAAKSFIRNLSRSMEKDPASLYPGKVDKIFQINDLVDLRLIDNETYIYIDNKRFVQCFNVLFNIGADKGRRYEDIRNMDEASRRLRGGYSQWFTRISPEEEFMAHCSNIQAFFENDLNTDILHSDIAFPLLKKLVSVGYKPAFRAFNKEIVKRYNEGTWETRWFLKSEGYLKNLNKEEKRALKKDKRLISYPYYRMPNLRDRKIESIMDDSFKNEDTIKMRLIRIFEYHDIESEFREVKKKYPFSRLLKAGKIILFYDLRRSKMWIWHGFNTTNRMRYYAIKSARRVRDKYGKDIKIISVDKDLHTVEFRNMLKIKEEPEYEVTENDLELLTSLSKERILLLLERLKKSESFPKENEIAGKRLEISENQRKSLETGIMKTQIIPKEDCDLFLKLVDEAIIKIKFIMKEESVDELTIPKESISEIFNRELFVISKIDGYPIFKPEVLECFVFMGILTIVEGNVMKFLKISQD